MVCTARYAYCETRRRSSLRCSIVSLWPIWRIHPRCPRNWKKGISPRPMRATTKSSRNCPGPWMATGRGCLPPCAICWTRPAMQPLDLPRQRLLEKLRRDLGAAGVEALDDRRVIEVMLNPDGALWVDVLGEGMRDTGQHIGRAQAENLLGTVAAALGMVVNASSPIVEGELPLDGSRFEGLMPPLVSAPVFAIRKKASEVYTLDEYVDSGVMRLDHIEAVRAAVAARKNILIAGGTGSGKTTLANAVLHDIGRVWGDERMVLIEDTVELQCTVPNRGELRTAEAADLTRLLRATLRLRPDRIVVGEVHGASASLTRLAQLVQESGAVVSPQRIAEAVHLIVFIARTSLGRRVEEVAQVLGWDGREYVVRSV